MINDRESISAGMKTSAGNNTSTITSSISSNIQNAIRYTCDSDSRNGTNNNLSI